MRVLTIPKPIFQHSLWLYSLARGQPSNGAAGLTGPPDWGTENSTPKGLEQRPNSFSVAACANFGEANARIFRYNS